MVGQIVDPFGRRRTMLYTIPIMAIALILASIFFYCTSSPRTKTHNKGGYADLSNRSDHFNWRGART